MTIEGIETILCDVQALARKRLSDVLELNLPWAAYDMGCCHGEIDLTQRILDLIHGVTYTKFKKRKNRVTIDKPYYR
jgi:hypothetical protein